MKEKSWLVAFSQGWTAVWHGSPDLEQACAASLLRNLPTLLPCALFYCVCTGTEELCDLVLRLPPPEQLGLGSDDVPRSVWPRPPRSAPLPPFGGGLVGCVRAAGPGVYVGKAVRTEVDEPGPGLVFAMARQRVELLL